LQAQESSQQVPMADIDMVNDILQEQSLSIAAQQQRESQGELLLSQSQQQFVAQDFSMESAQRMPEIN